jgi:hypothetical protein
MVNGENSSPDTRSIPNPTATTMAVRNQYFREETSSTKKPPDSVTLPNGF